MNVKVEEAGLNKVKLEIEVGAEILEEGLDKSYKKNAKRFNVPGFRKGRAPRPVIERYYGVEVLYSDAAEILCSEYYEKALKENGVEPVDMPEVDIVTLERGQPFVFTAAVEIKPKVVLGEYIGVEVEKKPVIITEDEVEAEIKAAADSHARIIPVEDRPSQIGDTVMIDYEGSVDGVPFEGGKGEGFNLELGSNRFIAGFEEQLTGKSAGDFVKVNVRFPDDYNASELSGKDAIFDVTVHSVKTKELPAIDDEFAQDVSEFDTLEEYRADVRKHLTERGEERAKTEFENTLIEKIAGGAQIDIPAVMIKRQAEQDIKDFEMRLAYQGIDLERYFTMSGTTREQLEESMNGRAEEEVRTRLVMEQVAKENELEVSGSEYEDELRKRAETYKKDYDEYAKTVSEDLADYIRSKLKTEKIVKFLTASAKQI